MSTVAGDAALITAEYRQMQQALHENPNYGVASIEYAPLVADVIEALGVKDLLDYGAGKGRLGVELQKYVQRPLTIRHYDPAIPKWSATPPPCEFVTCIDVLEHIEPELLDNVLEDLRRATLRAAMFTVHIGPAKKILPDGRNAHLTQQPPSWWLPRILAKFELVTFNRIPNGFWVGVEPKARS
ncbi:MAG: hypothetical protein H7Y16_02950 [Candidatus Parcubacteria bacterium]|nr:hypothetical protein [Burkholderiales bacterium]